MTQPAGSPGQVSGGDLGVLNGCLVEGDLEQQKRQRMLRRRALILSVAVQSIVVAAIVLVPLFGRPARIALANVTPLPPYYSRPAPRAITEAQPQQPPPVNTRRFWETLSIPPTIAFHEAPRSDDGQGEPRLDAISIPGATETPLNSRNVSVPPPPPPGGDRTHIVHITHISPAMLTHRVEPVYPALARQIGRSGRVELRAVIAADGTIQSLEAVAGDPLFYSSALEAVRQWRYTPTVLNGLQVEVDTYITVIYNVQR
jgi:periplasmic protein TonB